MPGDTEVIPYIRVVSHVTRDEEEGPDSFGMVQHSDIPFNVSRLKPHPEIVVFWTGDDSGEAGFQVTLAEDAARRLIKDLTTVLDDPSHDGVIYRSPLD